VSVWWWKLLRYVQPHRRGVGLLMLLALSSVALTLLAPWPLKLIVDNVLTGQPLPLAAGWIQFLPSGDGTFGELLWLTIGTVLLFLGKEAAEIARAYIQEGIGGRISQDLGAAVFDHLQRLSLRFHARAHVGDLVRRIVVDSRCGRDLLVEVLLPFMISLSTLVLMFIILVWINPILAVVAVAVAIPLGTVMRVIAPHMAQRTYEEQVLEGQMMAQAEQTLSALPVIQAFGREDYEDDRFRGLSMQTIYAFLRMTMAQMQFKLGVSGTTAFGTAAIMGIGGLQVVDGSLSVGGLLVFLAYLNSLYTPMVTLAYLATGYALAEARAQRISEVLETAVEVQEDRAAKALPDSPLGERGHLRMEGVTFGYEPDRPILHDITLDVKPGEVIALVGPSGAGKSTLASLILRFFDPWQGRIEINGTDLRRVQISSLRAQVSILLQDPFLLPLTVAENIAYGRPGASRDEIVATAVAAQADGFIRRLPQGYDTVIGERGGSLSGGERLRLAVARALLKDTPFLILDEPTAALDAETEAQLFEALDHLIAGRTTIIIAHRISTIRRADRIVVLDKGKITETGTHSELMRQGQLYAKLHALQESGTSLAAQMTATGQRWQKSAASEGSSG
jgi:ATP-binding cassette, subfamily B, bacterial